MTAPFIYITDGSGALIGPVKVPEIPGLGVQLPAGGVQLEQLLPEPDQGFAWALVAGQARQLPDFRGTVYSTADGGASQHGQLGELPEGLTLLPRPTEDHAWNGSAWEFRAELQAKNRKALAGRLCGRIDTAADAARHAVAGDPLRAMEYLRAAEEAQAFAAAGYPADQVPGYVAAWAIGDITPQQAADEILREAQVVDSVMQSLCRMRLTAKQQVLRMIGEGDIAKAHDVTDSSINAMRDVSSCK